MKMQQMVWKPSKGWFQPKVNAGSGSIQPQLLLVFGEGSLLKQPERLSEIKQHFPDAFVIGCSTAGEISGTTVSEGSISLTAVEFEKSFIKTLSRPVPTASDSFEAGKQLISEIPKDKLRHVFLLSDGLNVNGSELVRGMRESMPTGVSVTGGLAGDGARFAETLVFNEQGSTASGIITAVAFYGDQLEIGYGSFGGWDSFGIERIITRSKSNVLYEIDGQPALQLYKSFLGEKAAELPASGLLFPLSLRTTESDTPVVRTILSVSEADQSITFAGDMPQGSSVRLMKANIDRLIDGAVRAADECKTPLSGSSPDLAVLISCVGRRLVLKQLVEEEVEGVKNNLGEGTVLTGFYSYGEISPFSREAKCELHNQTMTITTFSER